jgi:hypothetical protein
MKKTLSAFSLFILSLALWGQTQNESGTIPSDKFRHTFSDASIALSPNILFNTPKGNIPAGGLRIKMYVSKRFSFDSDLMIGHQYAYFGPGVIGIPLWYSVASLFFGNDESYDFGPDEANGDNISMYLIGALIMLASAEHFAYHLPLRNYTEISPYVSFLRFKQFHTKENTDNQDDTESPVCFAAGLELNRYFKRFILTPYIDYDLSYKGHFHSLNCGIYLGYYFQNK